MKIDSKLFAHIFNDAFLLGSVDLQGHRFESTVGYLNQHLASLNPKDIPPSVYRLQKACNRLVTYEKKHRHLRTELDLSLAASELASDIRSLQVDDFLIFPGGWSGTPGHAMIYQCHPDKSGNLLFSINNSGAGIQYHQKKSQFDKETFNPVLTYKIPKDKLNNPNLETILKEIIRAKALSINLKNKDVSYDASYLYEQIFSQFGFLDGFIDENQGPPIDEWLTAGQVSGTCAQRSLHQMLKQRFDSRDEYRRFIYDFKFEALHQYFEETRSLGTLEDPKIYSQVKKAIKHCLRLLLLETENGDEPLFPRDKVINHKDILGEMLKTIKALESSDVLVDSSLPLHSNEMLKAQVYGRIYTMEFDVSMESAKEPKSYIERFDSATHHSFMSDVASLLRLTRSTSETLEHHATCELIEKFFNDIPLQDGVPVDTSRYQPYRFYYPKQASSDELIGVLNQLVELQKIYFKSVQALAGYQTILPRMDLFKLNIFASIYLLVQEHPFFKQYINRIAEGCDVFFDAALNSPYLVTYNPSLDKRLLQLRTILLDNLSSFNELTHHNHLLDKFPDEKKRFELEFYEIDNLDSKVKAAVIKDDLQALYVLYKNLQSDEPKYTSALKTFEAQRLMDINLGYKVPELQSHPYPPVARTYYELKYNSYTKSIHLHGPATGRDYDLEVGSSLVESTYDFSQGHTTFRPQYHAVNTQNSYKFNLDKNKPRSNLVQLVPTDQDALESYDTSRQGQIDAKTIESRELYHLKGNAHTQIILTLEYYLNHLSKLSDVNHQKYLEANLFQTGLLSELLGGSDKKTVFDLVDSLVEKGIKYFSDHLLLNERSLNLVRLQTYLMQYAFEQTQDESLLKKQFQKHSELIELNTENQSVVAELHQYRFEMVVLSSNWDKVFSTHYPDILESFFQMKANGNHLAWVDKNKIYQNQYASFKFGSYLLQKPSAFKTEYLLGLCLQLKLIKLGDVISITGTFPRYELNTARTSFKIDLAQGLIFLGRMIYTTTPLAITQHPIFKISGITCPERAFKSIDCHKIELNTAYGSFRFIISKDGSFTVHKQIEIDGTLQWYQLLANSYEQAEYYQTSEQHMVNFGEMVPDVLTASNRLTWVSVQNPSTLLITNESLSPAYHIELKTDWYDKTGHLNLIKDNKVQPDVFLLSKQSPSIQQLRDFESSRFIVATDATLAGGEITIELPRYQLKLTQPNEHSPITYEWKGRRLSLIDKPSIFGEGVNPLTFEDSNGQVLLFPVVPFITTGQPRRDEYYLLQPDTDAILLEKRQGPDTTKKDGIWNYDNTESSITIKLRDGEPYPENAEQALFLCYRYLGAHQMDKALAVLNDCEKRLGGLSGHFNELKFLSWIVNKLPQLMKKQSDQVILSTPALTACKLKALSLMSKFKAQGHAFEKPADLTIRPEFNKGFHQKQLQKVLQFESNFCAHIYNCFCDHQKTRRDLASKFNLSIRDRKSLLDFYYGHTNVEAKGALGYEWVQLQFDYLKREQHQLLLQGNVRALTDIEQERLDEIDSVIKKHQGVQRFQSKLVYKNISCEIPKSVKLINEYGSIYHHLVSSESLTDFESALVPEALLKNEILKLEVDELTLAQHYKALLRVANDKGHLLHDDLKTFCRSIMIAHRHVKLSEQSDNKLLLCYVLYHICCADTPLVLKSYSKNFEDVLSFAKTITPEEIFVPELQDDLSQLLTDAKTLWDGIEPPTTIIPPEVSKDFLPEMDLVQHLGVTDLVKARDAFCKVLKVFEKGQAEGTVIGEFDLFSEKESLAGAVKFEYLTMLQSKAIEIFDEVDSTELQSQLISTKKILNLQLSDLEESLLALANEGPDEADLQLLWSADILADKKQSLNMSKLMVLYFQSDKNRYREETGLSDDKINELHTLMAQFLSLSTEQQQLKRTQSALKKYQSALSPSEQKDRAFLLAKTLFASNLVDFVMEPSLAVLQHMEDILLYAPQKDALGRLLGQDHAGQFNEVVEKVIMGGGKSKVIAPSIAKKKANGQNLVILEVPPALLHTNYVDLQAASARLFDQRAFLFQFDRDSDISPERLKELYTLLTDVMLNQDYIVTTGISIQSLELKYFELLYQKPLESEYVDKSFYQEVIETWSESVSGLEKLLKLFKNRGDSLIDEVHQGLLLKKKLNFTIGDRQSISKSTINYVMQLYRFLEHVSLDETCTINPSATWLDAIKNRRIIEDDKMLKYGAYNLSYQLVYHAKSPLKQLVKSFGESKSSQQQKLLKYLLNDLESIPGFVLLAPKPVRDKLALYKQEINFMLPYTTQRKHGEHYGPSQNQELDPFTRACAIPYQANNVPSERSRFGNILETINFTVQSLFKKGISKELLFDTLEEWLIEARQLVYAGEYTSIDLTPVASTLKLLLQDESAKLSEIDLKDDDCVVAIHRRLEHNKDLIFDILQNKILPQVKIDKAILHHDAYNHVDIVRTCQGMSGTPWNHTTYHKRLSYNDESGLGSDALIVQAIKEKKPVIRALDFTNTRDYIEQLFNQYQADDHIRAFIDISASFKGIGNLDVAEGIANYIRNHPEQFSKLSPVQYVLFFNSDNELSAIDINHADAEVIVIGGSSETVINERLGVGPEERFTFYSQAHTVGVDIRQGAQTKAIATLDKDTHLQHFEQGALRMRGLVEGDQSIDLVVTSSLKSQSFKNLCTMMATNEAEQLKTDHFFAAIGQMKNLIRNHLKEKIFAISGDDSIEKKHIIFQKFKDFFVQDTELDLFLQYGAIVKAIDTSDILEKVKRSLLSSWQTTLIQANFTFDDDELENMSSSLNAIKLRYLQDGMCHKTQNDGFDQHLEVEVEQLVEVEVEKEIENVLFNPSFEPQDYSRGAYRHPKTLNEFCPTDKSGYKPLFSEDFLVSVNFIKTYYNQDTFLNHFLKPVHAILWEAKKPVGFKCTLLSQQEVTEIIETSGLNDNQWIGTTQHHVLYGQPPEDYLSEQSYQLLVEQIRYVNGEFQLLSTQKEPFHWLEDGFDKKLDYFYQYLLPTRETSHQDIVKLKTIFNSQSVIYRYITNNPQKNLEDTNWELEFPDIELDDTSKFTELAKAFVFAHDHQHDNLTEINWADQFELDYRGLGHIKSHAQKVEDFKIILGSIVHHYESSKDELFDQSGIKNMFVSLMKHEKDLFTRYFFDMASEYATTGDPICLELKLLEALFTIIPSMVGQHQFLVVKLLASDVEWQPIFEAIKMFCDKDASLLETILKADISLSSNKLTSLLVLPQTHETLLLFATHANLDKSHLGDLLERAVEMSPQPHFLNREMLRLLDSEPDLLTDLLDDYQINHQEMSCLCAWFSLRNLQVSGHEDLFWALAKNADVEKASLSLMEYIEPAYCDFSRFDFSLLISKHSELILYLSMKAEKISQDHIKEVVRRTQHQETFNKALELAENADVISEIIHSKLRSVEDSEVLLKKSNLQEIDIRTLLSEADTDEVILKIIAHQNSGTSTIDDILYKKYIGQDIPTTVLDELLTRIDLTDMQYASIFNAIEPSSEQVKFLKDNQCLSEDLAKLLFESYDLTEELGLVLLPLFESSESLSNILGQVKFSESTSLETVLEHDRVNAEIISMLLHYDFVDASFLEKAAAHHHLVENLDETANNVDQILEHEHCNEDVITNLLGQESLTPGQIKKMMRLDCVTKTHLQLMVAHVQDNKSLAESICKHKTILKDDEVRRSILSALFNSDFESISTYALEVARDDYQQSLLSFNDKAIALGYSIDLENYQVDLMTVDEGIHLLNQLTQTLALKIKQDKNVFFNLLNDLSDKASRLENRYGKQNKLAFDAIQSMISSLKEYGEKYFVSSRDPKTYSTKDFCDDCKSTIEYQVKEGKLNTHRYLFGTILAVLNNILKFIAHIFSGVNRDKFLSKDNRKYHFFDARTDTQKMADELDQNLDLFLDEKTNQMTQ